jgi:hypothetical protein
MADIIALYKQSERFYIEGIEIKECNKHVNLKIMLEYLRLTDQLANTSITHSSTV